MKHIQIFKPGKHRATSGAVIEFSESMMQAAAAAYDPAVHEAPLVVGHPTDNGPAYGWVKSLSFAEGVVLAEPDQVEATFSEMVNAGRFKKVSASWYLPDAPANPVPGTLYLRHVGFLGAQPPSIKGLKSASFAEKEEGVVEFADWTAIDNASLWGRMREFLIDKFTPEDADKVIPSWMVDELKVAAATKDAPAVIPGINYSEGNNMQTAEQLATQAADLKKREDALKAREAEARKKELVEFADSLVTAGQLLPANKDKVVAIMASLPAEAVVNFGEGDKKTETPALQALQELLKSQPKVVNFSEHSAAGKDTPEANTDNKAVADRANAYKNKQAAAGNSISFSEAVDAVHKNLDQPAK